MRHSRVILSSDYEFVILLVSLRSSIYEISSTKLAEIGSPSSGWLDLVHCIAGLFYSSQPILCRALGEGEGGCMAIHLSLLAEDFAMLVDLI